MVVDRNAHLALLIETVERCGEAAVSSADLMWSTNRSWPPLMVQSPRQSPAREDCALHTGVQAARHRTMKTVTLPSFIVSSLEISAPFNRENKRPRERGLFNRANV